MAYEAFISYETLTGSSYAEHLKDALEKPKDNKLFTFVAHKDLDGADEWKEKIDTALEGSPIFIIIFTSLTNSSEEFKRECEKAISLKKKILTCRWYRISISETEKLAKGLSNRQQVKFEDKSELANAAVHEVYKLRGANNEI